MLRINLMTEKWLGVQLMDGEVVNAEKNENCQGARGGAWVQQSVLQI
jgi:hypothetical protein